MTMKTTAYNHRKAFTLIEIMIAVAIIGVLASIALPNFIKANAIAKKDSCLDNMRHIQNAEDLWALDTNGQTGQTPLKSDLVPSYIWKWPTCGSVEYAIPAVGSNAVCPISAPGHFLTAPTPITPPTPPTPPAPPHPPSVSPSR